MVHYVNRIGLWYLNKSQVPMYGHCDIGPLSATNYETLKIIS